ncbi:proline-rich protein 2-like [Caloenas nicobarica]|uniref:proline-rich protein 2-like n=1 Tax=Caloenas nicobarica TaxID=187106 RepID=UPI0032B85184
MCRRAPRVAPPPAGAPTQPLSAGAFPRPPPSPRGSWSAPAGGRCLPLGHAPQWACPECGAAAFKGAETSREPAVGAPGHPWGRDAGRGGEPAPDRSEHRGLPRPAATGRRWEVPALQVPGGGSAGTQPRGIRPPPHPKPRGTHVPPRSPRPRGTCPPHLVGPPSVGSPPRGTRPRLVGPPSVGSPPPRGSRPPPWDLPPRTPGRRARPPRVTQRSGIGRRGRGNAPPAPTRYRTRVGQRSAPGRDGGRNPPLAMD